jgi:hypothetical protein
VYHDPAQFPLGPQAFQEVFTPVVKGGEVRYAVVMNGGQPQDVLPKRFPEVEGRAEV